jgi:hypothetical protein
MNKLEKHVVYLKFTYIMQKVFCLILLFLMSFHTIEFNNWQING